LLAHLCAENELTRMRLARQMPSVGDTEQACEQGGQAFRVRLTISPTPNPNFRRIDAQVSDARAPIVRISTVLGRF
jgi:general secretion pathway protein I